MTTKNAPPQKSKQKAATRKKATSPKGKAAQKEHAPLAAQEVELTKALFPEYEGLVLTIKQQLFCKAYVRPDISFNGTRAYIEAYSLTEIDDYFTAAQSASRLLKNVNIQKAISIELDRQLNDHEGLGRRVMQEWQRLAFFDVTEFLRVQGPFVYLESIEALPAHFKPAIKSIENTQMGVKVTFHDKQKALESIAKCLGMFTDTVRTVDEKYETLVQRLARQEAEGAKENV